MGLETRSGGNTVYLKLMDGKLVKKCKSADETGAVKRTNKNKVDVWEIIYDNLSGTLSGAEIKDSKDYGKFLELNIEDEGTTHNVSMGLKSGYANKFLYRFPNVDLSKEFKISPYDFMDKGKRIVGIAVYQDGEKLDPKWTTENPGKLPRAVQVEFDGKMQWDFGKVNAFLIKAFEHHLTSLPTTVTPVEEPLLAEGVDPQEEEDQDLPF